MDKKTIKQKEQVTLEKYNPSEIEAKWRKIWEEEKVYRPDIDKAKKPIGLAPNSAKASMAKQGKSFYNLMMFPYPSAEGLHVGNVYAFTGSDIYGRFQRMLGNYVFEPIGLDGFGIHSENYAIKVGRTPQEHAQISQENFYRQLHMIGNGFDWSRKLETYDPKYYKWTQWLFIQLFKKGLAYRKKAPVNFCPKDLTVLADEQVIDGKCERCGSVVEKRKLEQWFFEITKYADRLLDNIDALDWSEKVKIAQRNWIGKKAGIEITYTVVDQKGSPLVILNDSEGSQSIDKGKSLERDSSARPQNDKDKLSISVFTTRPDTNFGATFIAVAPEHPLVLKITTPEQKKAVEEYIKESLNKSEIDRLAEGKEKTGVFTGSYAINQLTGHKMPIWVSDFVLMGFGTGALVGVPGHDKRDFEFAQKFGLEIKRVVVGKDGDKSKISKIEQVQEEEGSMINSDFLDGLSIHEATEAAMDYLEEKGWGKRVSTYHLRDWLISRQRYWGPPIPMIHCEKCGWSPVPEDQLPLLLPELKDWKPTGKGEAPLAQLTDWVNTACPNCEGPAKRETDVSDTFLDSSWYFLRYPSTDIENIPFDADRTRKWLPVNMYIGGAEHSVLHLLYSRFTTMVLHDLELLDFEEPFAKFRAHGLLIKEGAKMSKSKGNVIIPDEYINKFGADTLRCYLMFLGPYLQGGDFYDSGIEGMHRFLKRVWYLITVNYERRTENKIPEERVRFMHKTIKKVTEDISELRYNTGIEAMMEWHNFLTEKLRTNDQELSKEVGLTGEEAETFLKLLAPFAPFMTEELWQQYFASDKKFESVHKASWPVYNNNYLIDNTSTIAIQINGKLRETITVEEPISKEEAIGMAQAHEKIANHLNGMKIKNTIYVPGKIVNFVTY